MFDPYSREHLSINGCTWDHRVQTSEDQEEPGHPVCLITGYVLEENVGHCEHNWEEI